jgi:hypothetical protein
VEDGRCRRHGRRMPRHKVTVGCPFADYRIKERESSYAHLEPEPVRSVQRVRAAGLLTGRNGAEKKGSEMVCLGGWGYYLLPLIPRVTDVAKWSQRTVRQEKP